MPYLVISDGEVVEETILDTELVSNVVEGGTQVYRFVDGHFEEFCPIDETDTDNWSRIC